MNIYVDGSDLKILKLKAVENGIPNQTLVSGIIHRHPKGLPVDQ